MAAEPRPIDPDELDGIRWALDHEAGSYPAGYHHLLADHDYLQRMVDDMKIRLALQYRRINDLKNQIEQLSVRRYQIEQRPE